MIGLTLVTVVAVLGAGLRSSVEGAVTDQVEAPTTSSTPATALSFGAAEGDAAREGRRRRRRPRTCGPTPRSSTGEESDVTGIDPATIDRVLHVRLGHAATTRTVPGHGRRRRRGRQGLRRRPRRRASASKLEIQSASGDERTVAVRGIYDPPQIDQMLGMVSITQQAFDETFPQPKNRFTFIDAGPAAEAALEGGRGAVHRRRSSTRATAFAKDYTKGFASFLNLLYVMLAFSVVVSLFGMVNTLVLSVFERTRELGMLRTIGMTRRQARRMIRHESVITALIGAALGLPLGIFLAALVTQALSQYDVGMSIPVADAGRVHAWSRCSPASPRRSSPPAGPRGSTCSTRCTTNDRHRHDPRRVAEISPRPPRAAASGIARWERPLLAGGLALVDAAPARPRDLGARHGDPRRARHRRGARRVAGRPAAPRSGRPASRSRLFVGLLALGFGVVSHGLHVVNSGPDWRDLTGVGMALGGIALVASGLAALAAPRRPPRRAGLGWRAAHGVGWLAVAAAFVMLVVDPARIRR